MFLLNIGLILLMMTCLKSEKIWKSPSAVDIQTSLETCQITQLLFLDVPRNNKIYSAAENSAVRCFTRELGLWRDDEGFKPELFVELLRKHKQPTEILEVVNYCNDRHRHTDLDKWANEAFYCFARGSMGPWIKEYIKNVYKKKITLK